MKLYYYQSYTETEFLWFLSNNFKTDCSCSARSFYIHIRTWQLSPPPTPLNSTSALRIETLSFWQAFLSSLLQLMLWNSILLNDRGISPFNMCHGLPDLPTNDRPVDDHPSIHPPLSPLYSSATRLGKYPVSHQGCKKAVANFPPKPHSHHQMSPLVMSHPPRTVSHHNPHIKVTPLSLDSQSLGRHLSWRNILKTCTAPLDFTASHLVSLWVPS